MLRYFFLLLVSVSCYGQTPDKSKYALLWEITGNGLEKPSYLLGTMHVNDRRVFEFPDSLIPYFRACDAYAMEIHPDTMMRYMLAPPKLDTIDKFKQRLSKKGYKDLNKSVKKETGLSLRDQPNKQPWILDHLLPGLTDNSKRKREIGYYEPKNPVFTVLDLFLFDFATRENKLTLGIEYPDDYDKITLDHFETIDRYGLPLYKQPKYDNYDFDKPESGTPTDSINGLERMVRAYQTGNLAILDSMNNGPGADTLWLKYWLHERNKIMAMRMDSLSHIRPTFFAVGCAHLPGAPGVIQLLRDKGFSVRRVEPIFSTASADLPKPNGYVPSWYQFTAEDNSFSVETVGEMYKVNQSNIFPAPFDIYYQFYLPRNEYRFIMHSKIGFDIADDSLRAQLIWRDGRITEAFGTISSGEVNDSIVWNGKNKGHEYNTSVPYLDTKTKARTFITERDGFMIMEVSKKQLDADPYAENFMNSFTILPSAIETLIPSWTQYAFGEKKFKLNIPEAEPAYMLEQSYYGVNRSWFNSPKSPFMYSVREVNNIENIPVNDTTHLLSLKSILVYPPREYDPKQDSIYTVNNMLTTFKYDTLQKGKALVRYQYYIVGKKNYTLSFVIPKDDQKAADGADRFCNSFFPPEPEDWNFEEYSNDSLGISVHFPIEFEEAKSENLYDSYSGSANYAGVTENHLALTAQNPNINDACRLLVFQLNPYLRFKDQDSLQNWLVNKLNTFNNELPRYVYDSIIERKIINVDGQEVIALKTYSNENHQSSTFRILQSGQYVYIWVSLSNEKQPANPNIDKFLNANIKAPKSDINFFAEDFDAIFANLHSSDSLTRLYSLSALAINNAKPKHLPMLMQLMREEFVKVVAENQENENYDFYTSREADFIRLLARSGKNEAINYLDSFYREASEIPRAQDLCADMLNEMATTEALDRLFLLYGEDAFMDKSNFFMPMKTFEDSLPLLLKYFPKLLKIHKDYPQYLRTLQSIVLNWYKKDAARTEVIMDMWFEHEFQDIKDRILHNYDAEEDEFVLPGAELAVSSQSKKKLLNFISSNLMRISSSLVSVSVVFLVKNDMEISDAHWAYFEKKSYFYNILSRLDEDSLVAKVPAKYLTNDKILSYFTRDIYSFATAKPQSLGLRKEKMKDGSTLDFELYVIKSAVGIYDELVEHSGKKTYYRLSVVIMNPNIKVRKDLSDIYVLYSEDDYNPKKLEDQYKVLVTRYELMKENIPSHKEN